jgi:hypothetical protein
MYGFSKVQTRLTLYVKTLFELIIYSSAEILEACNECK